MAEKRSKLAEIKTKPTAASVEDFLNAVGDEQKRKDSFSLLEMMKEATGEEPKMWGSSLIGFGEKRYESPATGREVDWLLIGFSPRKANLTLYINDSSSGSNDLMEKLGKHTTGKGCLYIKRLSDVDETVVEQLIRRAFDRVTKTDAIT